MFARRLFVFTILGLFVCAAASLLWAADDKTAALESKLQKLLGERVETAMEGVAANEAAYNAGTVTLDSLIQSREDLVKARLALAKTAAEREIALKENAQGLRHREDEIAKLY